EFAQARLDFTRLANVSDHRVKRLESVARDAKHGRFVRWNFPGGDKLLRDANGHAAGGFSKDALAFGEHADAVANFFVGNIIRTAARLLHDLERVKTISRRANSQGFGNRVRLHRLE